MNKKQNYCIEIDCNNIVLGLNTRCRSHAMKQYLATHPEKLQKLKNQKGKNNFNYKHGNTYRDKVYYCIEPSCYNKVSRGDNKCKRCANKRKNNPGYIDGRTFLRNNIRRLKECVEWKNKVFKRDDYICQHCDKTNCYLEAHHKKEFVIILNEFLQEYNQFSPIEDKETLVRLAITYKPFWDVDNGET